MKKFRRYLALTVWVSAIVLMFVACESDLDVKQVYSFGLETMPVQKTIVNGETAEIRCMLVREGEYEQARYYIRYFQPDGRGELRMDNGTVFAPLKSFYILIYTLNNKK